MALQPPRLVVPLLVAAAAALVVAAPAIAKKRKAPRAAALNVAVLPFTGKGSGGNDAKEALELELELVETAAVVASDAVADDTRRLRTPYQADALAPILSRRAVDVLVTGERAVGKDDEDVLLVVAYAKDGAPRFFVELPLGRDPQDTAVAVIDALRPALSAWKRQRPVKLPGAEPKRADRSVRMADVLADDDEDAAPPRRETVSKAEPARRRAEPEDVEPPRAARDQHRDTSPLAFTKDDADDEPARPKKRKRSLSIDDDAPEETVARSTIDDAGRRIDAVDEAEVPADGALAHTLAVTAAFDGATWAYSFDGDAVGSAKVNAAFFPGGSVAVDAWPMRSFGVPWLGLEADGAVAFVPFRINARQVPVTPEALTATHYRLGVMVKGRYALKNGIAFGARLGYRYYGASIEAQTVDVGGQTENLTVVPGFEFHTAAIGAEAFVPILLGKQRLEIDLKADALPLTYYEEKPDDPGGTSLAYGWYASAGVRYDIVAGFYGELRGQTIGAIADYSNQGGRKIFVGDQLETLAGGDVLNFTLGFSAGVGFMF
ncbi:MAG: hypothetical protein A2138_07925 [Deltaproteobacteria bacterium RBG_16_71_12]|nr:MAG: hypothetical protein A2138_07925 [Deltaproteobacteria bacterium RBG_16_71_12]